MGIIRKKTVRPGEGGVKYVCDVCSVDITSTVRVRCAHSACNEYDLCVQCFANGKSSNAHQPGTHPYRVIEQNSFPIFDEDWGADEELLLIEGCEIYGLGSWAEIADHIGGFRTKDEVRDHYLKTYIESPNFPLPKRASPYDTELANKISREEFQARKKRRIEERKEKARNAPAVQPKTKPVQSHPTCHDISGYMPGRLEFETEYANEAEDAVQLMQFDPGNGIAAKTGELESEWELKLTVMEIYNARLTERIERKKVIFEHNLLECRENMKVEKKRTKEERDLINKTKPFARMMNRHDYNDFCQGLLEEHNLRLAIAQLQEWRRMRISDLRSGEKYEVEKAQRAQRNQGSMDRERLSVSQRGKAKEAAEPASLTSVLVAPDLPPDFVPAADSLLGLKNTAGADGYDMNMNGSISTSFRQSRYMPPPVPGVSPMVLMQANAPDVQILSLEERKLCEVCRLQPKPYIMLKERLLATASTSAGVLKKKQVKDISRLDSQKAARIYEFFLHAGWISKE